MRSLQPLHARSWRVGNILNVTRGGRRVWLRGIHGLAHRRRMLSTWAETSIVHIMHNVQRLLQGEATCCVEVRSTVCGEEKKTHRDEMKSESALTAEVPRQCPHLRASSLRCSSTALASYRNHSQDYFVLFARLSVFVASAIQMQAPVLCCRVT